MANYKRKRPKTASTHGGKHSGGYWLRHHPRWFDVVFHTRPQRRRDQEVTRAVVRGALDPDAACWARDKRPTQYYW